MLLTTDAIHAFFCSETVTIDQHRLSLCWQNNEGKMRPLTIKWLCPVLLLNIAILQRKMYRPIDGAVKRLFFLLKPIANPCPTHVRKDGTSIPRAVEVNTSSRFAEPIGLNSNSIIENK